MQLVALYKTFDGDEWIAASLASIYDHVDAIVMVHSDVSWLGEEGNTVRDAAMAWADEHDHLGKIHHLNVRTKTQEQQYAIGVSVIRNQWPDAVVLAVDSDEIWEGKYLERAKEQIASDKASPAFRCNMHSYIKTPLYRVDPPWGSPTCFFREPELLTESPRGCRAPASQLDNVWMHHYTYVRRSPDLVWRKIQQSCLADRDEIVVENWMRDVYDRLPDGADVHAFVRWRHVWKCVRPVWWSDVPKATRECEFMRQFWPDGLLMDGEKNELFRLAHGRRQAIDLGTYKGLSAVILGLACEKCHTVDAYDQVPDSAVANRDDPDQYQRMKHDTSFAANCDLFRRFGNITCEQALTSEAAARWPHGSVDVLFIDADHSQQGTLANLWAWWPRLKAGGIVIFHDDNDLHPGVQQVVKMLADRDVLLQAGEDLPERTLLVERRELARFSGSLAAFEKVKEWTS